MKPASIISLIIAVILIALGIVTCYIAKNMAVKNGEALFAEEVDGDFVKTVDLTESDISKISLITDDVKVNIYGNCDNLNESDPNHRLNSSIEFVNFSENYYSLSVNNRVLSFDEIPDLASMLKFWENGVSFKGVRYYLNFKRHPDTNKEKIINIYLCSDKEIKIFDLQSKNSTLNIFDMISSTDYNVNSDELLMKIDNISTSSKVNINSNSSPAKNVKIDMTSNASIDTMTVNADSLEMTTEHLIIKNAINISCKTGRIAVRSDNGTENVNLDFRSNTGFITVNDKPVTSPYTHAGNSDGILSSIKITTESATIIWNEIDVPEVE